MGVLKISKSLREYLQARISDIRAGAPGVLSGDGTALCVGGGLGCGAYVSPAGDVFFETYELGDDSPPMLDRSRRGQVLALVLGAQNHPVLAELLPLRAEDARTCEMCGGEGYVPGFLGVLCCTCSGLGWLSKTVFQQPNEPPTP
jgi:hypothetical protein